MKLSRKLAFLLILANLLMVIHTGMLPSWNHFRTRIITIHPPREVLNSPVSLETSLPKENVEKRDDRSTLIGHEEEEDYKTMIELRFAERRQRVQEQCQRLKGEMKSDMIFNFRKMWYSPKHDLLVCVNRKAGSTSLKNHLFAMENATNEVEILARTHFSTAHLKERVKRPLRLTLVRHPLERLVSAFRDRFRDGKPVIRRNVRRESQKLFKPIKGKRIRLNFTQFLQLVAYEHLVEEGELENWHWETYYFACSYCDIDYDYIVFMETYKEDMAFVFEQIGERSRDASKVYRATNGAENSNKYGAYMDYYRDVPVSTLSDIYQVFKYDLVMHGYRLAPEIEKRLREYGTQLFDP